MLFYLRKTIYAAIVRPENENMQKKQEGQTPDDKKKCCHSEQCH